MGAGTRGSAMMMECEDCHAVYDTDGDSCHARFHTLLALDHSRRQPWGSRHGQAFSAFALQHPTTHGTSLDRAWSALWRIYILAEAPANVFDELLGRRTPVSASRPVPTRAAAPVAPPATTIRDLGDFDAATYPALLDKWCHAAILMWLTEPPVTFT